MLDDDDPAVRGRRRGVLDVPGGRLMYGRSGGCCRARSRCGLLLLLVLVLAVVAVCFLWVFPRSRPSCPSTTTRWTRGRRDRAATHPTAEAGMTRILVVDNYDSFVFTIVGYLQQLGAECDVVRNDAARRPTPATATTACWSRPARAPPRRPASAMA